MKDIISKINESQTTGRNIQDYGKSWTTEWTPEYFIDMFTFFVNGLSKGLEDDLNAYKNNIKQYAKVKENIKLIEEVKKLINKK